jgi:hypothetical protein
MNQKYETSVATIEDMGNRLIRVFVKKAAVIDQKGVKESRVIFDKILQGQKGLILTVFSEFNTASKGVKGEFEALNHTGLKAAEAFVVTGLSNRIELEYFTKMTKTIYPTAVFNQEKEAIKRLMEFQD